jgi:hypothetical protein
MFLSESVCCVPRVYRSATLLLFEMVGGVGLEPTGANGWDFPLQCIAVRFLVGSDVFVFVPDTNEFLICCDTPYRVFRMDGAYRGVRFWC